MHLQVQGVSVSAAHVNLARASLLGIIVPDWTGMLSQGMAYIPRAVKDLGFDNPRGKMGRIHRRADGLPISHLPGNRCGGWQLTRSRLPPELES